jgi:hypothetical protein
MLKKILPLSVFLLLAAFSVLHCAAQQKSQAEEYALKAAFVYNFTRFIEWTPSNDADEFVIGVLGYSPIIKHLQEISQTKSVNGKKIVIKQFYTPDEMKFCHVLFIPRQTNYSLHSILDNVSKGTLTISEEDGYASLGTALNFVVVNNKLKFESNVKAIDAAGLKASSELLRLAIIVN